MQDDSQLPKLTEEDLCKLVPARCYKSAVTRHTEKVKQLLDGKKGQPLMTVEEIAAFVGICPGNVSNLKIHSLLPGYTVRMPNRARLFGHPETVAQVAEAMKAGKA